MGKRTEWQKTLIADVEKMSNAELFQYLIDAQIPDDYDGAFTDRGYWERQYSEELMREKLADWLKG